MNRSAEIYANSILADARRATALYGAFVDRAW